MDTYPFYGKTHTGILWTMPLVQRQNQLNKNKAAFQFTFWKTDFDEHSLIGLSQYEIRASKVKLHSGHPRSLIFISGNVFQRASEVCKTRLLTESVWDLQVFDFKDYFRVTWVITMKLFVWGRNLVLWKPNQRVLVEISLSKRKNRDFGKKLSKKREKKLRNSWS